MPFFFLSLQFAECARLIFRFSKIMFSALFVRCVRASISNFFSRFEHLPYFSVSARHWRCRQIFTIPALLPFRWLFDQKERINMRGREPLSFVCDERQVFIRSESNLFSVSLFLPLPLTLDSAFFSNFFHFVQIEICETERRWDENKERREIADTKKKNIKFIIIEHSFLSERQSLYRRRHRLYECATNWKRQTQWVSMHDGRHHHHHHWCKVQRLIYAFIPIRNENFMRSQFKMDALNDQTRQPLTWCAFQLK